MSYTTFVRMVSSDATVAEGIIQLMMWYSWSRIAVIQQEEDFFSSVRCYYIITMPPLHSLYIGNTMMKWGVTAACILT